MLKLVLILSVFILSGMLSACGGGEYPVPYDDSCTGYPAAYIPGSTAEDDKELTFPGETNLESLGYARAVALGYNPNLVIVGLFAFCN